MLDSRYIIGRMHCVNGSFSLHHIGIVGFFLWRFFFSPTFQDHVDILFVFFFPWRFMAAYKLPGQPHIAVALNLTMILWMRLLSTMLRCCSMRISCIRFLRGFFCCCLQLFCVVHNINCQLRLNVKSLRERKKDSIVILTNIQFTEPRNSVSRILTTVCTRLLQAFWMLLEVCNTGNNYKQCYFS